MSERRPFEVYVFGPFRLDVRERQLQRDGEPVVLRAKLFETLVVLVRQAGKLVTREELIAAVWPDTIVEEGNLSHNVSALRKALGEGDAPYVETVPRSGYRFVHALDATAAPPRDEGDARARARRCVAQGAWREAHAALVEAGAEAPLSPAERQTLAEAARWSGHFDELVPLLEDAAKAWFDADEPVRAALVSLQLAGVVLDRSHAALAKSYVRQAERRLPPAPPDSGLALVAHSRLRQMRARLCWFEADWEGALALAHESLALALRAEDPDAEALAAMDVALTLLALERFVEAPPFLDEVGAHVTAGNLGPYAAGMVQCGLIISWQALGRPERALEWSQVSNRWADASGVAFFLSLCRVHCGELQGLRGELAHAEADLALGAEELARAKSFLAGSALRELGTVRLRRGDFVGAEAAFARALQLGTDPQPGYALLRAARGEPLPARRDLERFLSSEGHGQRNLLDRQNLLGVLGAHVRLACVTGALDAARASLARMQSIAAATASPTHRAHVDTAHGELALAAGEPAEALARFAAAWRAWTDLGAPFEAAALRARLAEALLSEGDATRARLELQGAAERFGALGAAHELALVLRRIESLPASAPPRVAPVRVSASIARAPELEALLGPAAWRTLVTWLDRQLLACLAAHGARLVDTSARWTAEFESRTAAETCAAALQTALRDHRTQHGFAPELVVKWPDPAATPSSPAHREPARTTRKRSSPPK